MESPLRLPRPARVVLLTFGLCMIALACRSLRIRSMEHLLATQRYEDVYYVPPTHWLRVFSAGYDEALADLLWLRSLVYFGDELTHRGEVRHLYDYAEAMLALDPHFRQVYRWAASSALYRTGTITVDDAHRAVDFLERAVRLYPDDGELAWDLGATYTYELVPMLESQQAQAEARRKGAEHLHVAALRGAAPKWVALGNAHHLQRLGHAEQAIRHLQEAYAITSDPELREEMARALAQLRSAAAAEAFRRATEELEQAHQRDFPYTSTELYLLLGARPPFDGLALLQAGFDPLAATAPAGFGMSGVDESQ